MGTVDDMETPGVANAVRVGAHRASRRAGEATGAVKDGVGAAPELVRAKTEGNPLLVGLVAFGGGLVLASALKSSDTERHAAERVLQGLEPLKEQLLSAGKEVAGELQQSAQGRAEKVKKRATSGTQRLKSEAQVSVNEVKGQAQGASSRVQKRAQGAASTVQKRAQGASQEVRKQAQRSSRAAKGAAAHPPRRTSRGSGGLA